ncbi:MAG: GTP cyclohydrolase FolE2 [Candidatus Hatepunaea meridiana]|nr:GTP cyclohydrolase FolE2 [Candidatus Hatepunaea meridiana]
MIDVQASPDTRNISIDKVGVKNLRYPIKVRQKAGGYQRTIAKINVFVDLFAEYRGAHLSRFVELIDGISGQELTVFTLPDILNSIKDRFDSMTAEININFPYFLRRKAPVSEKQGLMDYRCRFHGRLDGKMDFIYGVTAPVTSLCPCSKEISDRGAHNQRAEVSVDIRSKKGKLVWFEEIIDMIEASGSAPVYSILKREDEKYVTELAYDNPVFVEDIVRSIAEKLNVDKRITWFKVQVNSMESIHNHSAYAVIEKETGK